MKFCNNTETDKFLKKNHKEKAKARTTFLSIRAFVH